MKSSIYSYMRDDGGNKIGLLYAEKGEDNVVRIGYSKVNSKHEDKFDFDEGLKIAKKRLGIQQTEIPNCVYSYYYSFLKRVSNFFKDDRIFVGCVKNLYFPKI